MEISVSDTEKEVCLIVSHFPMNSIYDLAQALLRLQSGSKIEEVEFSLEPDFALWVLEVIGEKLSLSVYPDSRRARESLSCWNKSDALESIWSWEFPTRELNEYKIKAKSA